MNRFTQEIFNAALSALTAGGAFADNTQIATLATPTIKQEKILDATISRCPDTVCRSASTLVTLAFQLASVAKRFSKFKDHTSGDKVLTPEQLETCNQAAKAK